MGTAIQKKLYGDALSRTIDRVRTLQYMYDNMGTLIKQGVTNEFDELKQSYANAETFMRQRDYLSSGIAMGELAYKVVPLVLGLVGAARAGAVTIARIAEKGLWSSMTEAAAAMKSVVRSPSTATKTVIGRVLTRAERLAAFIDDADGLRKRFGLGAALDRNGGNISIAEVDVPAFGESTTMRAFSNNPQLSNAAKKKFLSDSVSEDEKNWILKPLEVNRKGEIGKGSVRKYDSEFKILETVARKLGNNFDARGRIDLFTEAMPCRSCAEIDGGIIDQFKARYPNIDVQIYWRPDAPVDEWRLRR